MLSKMTYLFDESPVKSSFDLKGCAGDSLTKGKLNTKF